MPFDRAERERLFTRFASGAPAVRTALTRLPAQAVDWRPAPGKWSAREIVWHCADAEMCTAARIRYLVCDKAPLIPWYDEAAWARKLDYQALPLEPALELMTMVRANTTLLIRTLPPKAWKAEGWHTLHGRFTAEDWLRYYAGHLHRHARQIGRNRAAWEASTRRRTGCSPAS